MSEAPRKTATRAAAVPKSKAAKTAASPPAAKAPRSTPAAAAPSAAKAGAAAPAATARKAAPAPKAAKAVVAPSAPALPDPSRTAATTAATTAAPAPAAAASAAPRHDSRTSGPSLYERIAERAYLLFVQRGCVHGHAEQDWVQAEREVLAATPTPQP